MVIARSINLTGHYQDNTTYIRTLASLTSIMMKWMVIVDMASLLIIIHPFHQICET
jgi:hypothetical protein